MQDLGAELVLDGGVLREVVKHETVEEAVLCDIDEAVPRVSKQYLPKMAAGLTHPKSNVIIGDGFAFLQKPENKASFDVIIVDSTDPIGVGEVLFTDDFYRNTARILTEGGLIVNQCGVPFMQADELREVRRDCPGVPELLTNMYINSVWRVYS